MVCECRVFFNNLQDRPCRLVKNQTLNHFLYIKVMNFFIQAFTKVSPHFFIKKPLNLIICQLKINSPSYQNPALRRLTHLSPHLSGQ